MLESQKIAQPQWTAEWPFLMDREIATHAFFPVGLRVHRELEAQAARTPEAVAVVHGNRTLTYGELNQKSNRLGRYLRTLGVGPHTQVAVCATPGLERLTALLAVLKAGGAHVSLDPAQPLRPTNLQASGMPPIADFHG